MTCLFVPSRHRSSSQNCDRACRPRARGAPPQWWAKDDPGRQARLGVRLLGLLIGLTAVALTTPSAWAQCDIPPGMAVAAVHQNEAVTGPVSSFVSYPLQGDMTHFNQFGALFSPPGPITITHVCIGVHSNMAGVVAEVQILAGGVTAPILHSEPFTVAPNADGYQLVELAAPLPLAGASPYTVAVEYPNVPANTLHQGVGTRTSGDCTAWVQHPAPPPTPGSFLVDYDCNDIACGFCPFISGSLPHPSFNMNAPIIRAMELVAAPGPPTLCDIPAGATIVDVRQNENVIGPVTSFVSWPQAGTMIHGNLLGHSFPPPASPPMTITHVCVGVHSNMAGVVAEIEIWDGFPVFPASNLHTQPFTVAPNANGYQLVELTTQVPVGPGSAWIGVEYPNVPANVLHQGVGTRTSGECTSWVLAPAPPPTPGVLAHEYDCNPNCSPCLFIAGTLPHPNFHLNAPIIRAMELVLPSGPPNDLCINATPIGLLPQMYDPPTSFDNFGAGTDGPAEPACGFTGVDDSDVWFEYLPSLGCEQEVKVAPEVGTLPRTRLLAVYEGGCPATGGVLIGCDESDVAASVTFTPTPGVPYIIRVGTPGGAAGQGDSRIKIETTCNGADFNNDCAVGVPDLLFLLSHWGPGPPGLPGTCATSCNLQSPSGCYCDDLCFIFDDCCVDVCDHCDHFDCPLHPCDPLSGTGSGCGVPALLALLAAWGPCP